MSYAVKEVFLTLQGEGAHAGRRAVFCRLRGCNLWSGQEADRAVRNVNFATPILSAWMARVAGAMPMADSLAAVIEEEWGAENEARWVVLTGGEPLLQVDEALIEALHRRGFAVAVETNGTIDPPSGLDWLCVSPKAGTQLRVRAGHELKLVYPQPGAPPEDFTALSFERFSLQPMDGPNVAENTSKAVDYCLKHPAWRLSLQTHKTLGIR